MLAEGDRLLIATWGKPKDGDRLAERRPEMIMDLNQGSADHEYIESEKLVVIPMMMDGTLAAYKVQ